MNVIPFVRPGSQGNVKLISLIEEAIGHKNSQDIHEIFYNNQFKSMKKAQKEGTTFLVPCIEGKTGYYTVDRLKSMGYAFGNTFDLANFMIKNLAEIKKFSAVLAMSDDSKLEIKESRGVYFPYAHAGNHRRRRIFGVYNAGSKFSSRHAVIVFKPEAGQV